VDWSELLDGSISRSVVSTLKEVLQSEEEMVAATHLSSWKSYFFVD
jgi:hypothetical protein